jgi:hypothetical protein
LTVYREDWMIGVVAQPAADIVVRGIVAPIRWLPLPRRGTMLADPGCEIHPNGALTFYAEYLDHRNNRGEIWSADVDAGGDPSQAVFKPLLSDTIHLSYPFPFQDESGARFLTAEMWQAGDLRVWRYHDLGWHPAGVLFPGRPVVDPTLWRGPDRWWLFCTFQDDLPNERLYLFHSPRLGQPWIQHRQNPVKRDRGASRPAGPIFRANDLLIRPAQDCSTTYGGAVVLNAIRHIDPDLFIEQPVRRLEPGPGPYQHGMHTFCPAGDFTLVDGKRMRPDAAGIAHRLRARCAAGRSRWRRFQTIS